MKSKAVLIGVLSLLSGPALADGGIGVVKFLRGNVTIERAGSPVAVAKGTQIQRGDRVVTGSNGFIHINMRRAAPVTVGPQATVTLDRFAAGEDPVVKQQTPSLLKGLASYVAVNRQR